MTINKINTAYGEFPELKNRQEGVIYIDLKNKRFEMFCPCGCGGRCNLSGHTLIEHGDDTVTLSPSVLIGDCDSHFFIDRNKVVWCK